MSRVSTPPLIPSTSAQQTPVFVETSMKNTLVQLVKVAKIGHRGRAPSLAKNMEIQTILDNDLFMIQTDRRTKLTPPQQYRLVHVLAQFFLERAEDNSRFSYFEAIFLGRENDPVLHDFRIDILLQLTSFSLHFPVLQVFNDLSSWLSKITDAKQALYYSEQIVEVLVDNFVVNSDMENKLFEYLMPLDKSCAEFSATFFALAPYLGLVNESMCIILESMSINHMQFILRHLRDTPYLAEVFSKKTVPELVKYVINDYGSPNGSKRILPMLCYILYRWGVEDEKEKGGKEEDEEEGEEIEKKTDEGKEIKNVDTFSKFPIDVLDLALANETYWDKVRLSLIAAAILCSKKPQSYINKKLNQLQVPLAFQSSIDEFKEGKITVYDMKKEPEEKKE